MDANKNVMDGTMIKLMAKSDIGLQAAVHSQTDGPGPKPHIKRSESIDDIFVTPEMEVIEASYLLFDEDLDLIAVNITIDSLLLMNLPTIVPAKAQKLNSDVNRVREEYIKLLEDSV